MMEKLEEALSGQVDVYLVGLKILYIGTERFCFAEVGFAMA